MDGCRSHNLCRPLSRVSCLCCDGAASVVSTGGQGTGLLAADSDADGKRDEKRKAMCVRQQESSIEGFPDRGRGSDGWVRQRARKTSLLAKSSAYKHDRLRKSSGVAHVMGTEPQQELQPGLCPARPSDRLWIRTAALSLSLSSPTPALNRAPN